VSSRRYLWYHAGRPSMIGRRWSVVGRSGASTCQSCMRSAAPDLPTTDIRSKCGIMRAMQYNSTPPDDEIAAALAAVRAYMEQREIANPVAPAAGSWHAAAVFDAQRLPATRNGRHRAWGTIDRAAREGSWSYGITGL
jgi:formate dehydrogenase assembly factor FdhD